MRPGDFVVANVCLERLLSEGGMGSVWVADHLTLSTQVAVKFMGADMAQNADAIARFKREASAAAQIKSPHIVQVFDHGLTAEGVPYIVMELLHGEDLEHRLKRGVLSVGDTLTVVRHMCKALGRAHQQGIVHRDIKPANVFLVEADGDIFVKVLDFGIAKRDTEDGLVTSKTQSGTILGTPTYMSPEQIMGTAPVDARADLWATAVVAYNCLTGTVPFDGETVGSLAVSIHAATFLPVTMRVPGLPPSLDTWFSRALARSIGERFQTAKELADAFAAAVPKELRSMHPPGDSGPLSELGAPNDRATMDLRPDALAAARLASPNATPPPVRIRALDAIGEEPETSRSFAMPAAIVGGVALVVGAAAVFLFSRPPEPPPSLAASSAAPTTPVPVAAVPDAAPPAVAASPSASPSAVASVAPPDLAAAPEARAVAVEPDGVETKPVAPKPSPPAQAPPRPTAAETPRHTENASHRVPFGVLAVPELPQIAGATPSASPASPRADAAAPKR
jgi:serine/threonine-protein kinase